MTIFAILISTCGARSIACREPPREDLDQLLLLNVYDVHESFRQLPQVKDVIKKLGDDANVMQNVRRRPIGDGPTKCPYGSDGHKLEHFILSSNGTLCPTHNVINYDDNRVPSTLFEVKCSCSKCAISSDEYTVSSKHSTPTRLGCTPLLYYTRVLRRVGCRDNVYVYQPIWEPLVVGCFCGHESSREETAKGHAKSAADDKN